MKKTAWVAGASGLIGSHLIELLNAHPAYDKVIALVRQKIQGAPYNLPKVEQRCVDYTQLQAPEYEQVDDVFCALGSTTKKTPDKSLYFTLSNEAEESKLYSDAFNNFVKLLTENPPKNLDWHYEFLTNHTHMTTSIPAFYNGITHVFSSYQAPRFASYRAYLDFGGMQGMEAHYNKRAKIYGIDKNIPEKTLLNLASLLLNEGKTEESLNVFLTLTNDFPESAASFSGLGQVYHSMKQYDKSIIAHQKAVSLSTKLNPDWQQERFQSRLNKVNEIVQLLN